MLQAGKFDALRNELGVPVAEMVVATMKKKRDQFSLLGTPESSDESETESQADSELHSDTETSETQHEPDYLAELEKLCFIAAPNGLADSGYDRESKMNSLVARPRRASNANANANANGKQVSTEPADDQPRQDFDEWKEKPPLTWKPRHVSDWLRFQGSEFFGLASQVEMYEIHGARLLDLSEAEMSKMNIKKQQRRDLRTKLKELIAASNRGQEPCITSRILFFFSHFSSVCHIKSE